MNQRTSISLDVHARSVAGCAIDETTDEVTHRRFGYHPDESIDWVGSLPGPTAVTYEAGPTGVRARQALRTGRYQLSGGSALEAAAPGQGSGEDRCA